MEPETKNCQNCKKDFVIEMEDFNFYEKIKVPPPTWCPECRMKRRMVFRNERKLFRQKDMLSGESILAIYPTETSLVIKDKDWWSQDKWNPLDYGIDIDFSKPFLEQIFDLSKKVPKYQSASTNMINSDYSANASDLRNCYLMFNSNFTEDCAYGNGVDFSRNCYDNSHIQKSERCYESFWLTNCYETHFSSQCDNCISLWFSKNCKDCQNCFGCVNQRSKKYCIFNVQYSKEEYEEKLRDMNLHSWNSIIDNGKRAKDFWLKFPNKYIQGIQNKDVSGEYISHSKNVKNSYLIRESEDLKYVQYSQVPSSRDCMDCSLIGCHSELFYEDCICGWGATNLRFCCECWDGGREFEYSMFCGRTASNLFGCVGITKQQYCILNKQYSKEEYFELREKIIKHMNKNPYIDQKGRVYKYGEFFPPEFSPFAYDQTTIAEHFPSNKEEAEKLGVWWQDNNPNEYKITMSFSDISDLIEDVEEKIIKEVIECSKCGRAYRIIEPEFKFLKQMNIPVPRSCVDCRHYSRISQRNKSKIYPRNCMCEGKDSKDNIYQNTVEHFHGNSSCPNEFETSYSPDRSDIVYCEKCYHQEVY